SALPGMAQVYIFENRGAEIGVTLQHPHGQIYGYPYITPRTQQLLAQLDTYGPALFADILKQEQAGPRRLLSGEHWTAFVPFAARWPVEAHLLPHEHVADFAETSQEQRDELAVLYLRLLRGVDALYDGPTPYIAAWHQAPVRSHRGSARLHLRLMSPRRGADKLKYQGAANRAWAPGSATSRPRPRPNGCARRSPERTRRTPPDEPAALGARRVRGCLTRGRSRAGRGGCRP